MQDDDSGDYISIKNNSTLYDQGINTILRIHGVTSTIDRTIFQQLVYLANKDGVVSLSSIIKDSICEEISINKSNFSKNIKRLVDANIIQGNKGTYIINKTIFNKLNQLESGDSNLITIRLC